MSDVRMNFKNMYQDYNCDLCDEGLSQSVSHLLDCSTIQRNCSEVYNNCDVEFHDIFKDPKLQLQATRLFTAIFATKTKLEGDDDENVDD